jgi:hypothetical protein
MGLPRVHLSTRLVLLDSLMHVAEYTPYEHIAYMP